MVSAENDIIQKPDWLGDSVEIRLNSRWPTNDYSQLYRLAQDVSQARALKSHIWVATSGSTATDIAGIKLVALGKEAFLNSARAVNLHLSATSRDIWTQVLPLSHVGGLGVEARAYLSGAKVVSGLREQKWDAGYFYQTLQKESSTLSALVPTQIYDLLQLGLRAPSQLRAIVVGGGVFSQDLYWQARQLGWPVLPSYGMTETCSQIATASLESLSFEKSLDFLFPSMDLLSHAQARQNSEGFLEVHSNSLFTCYAQNGREPSSWDPKHKNWFTSEDKGQVSGNALQISGRGQDYIKIGGEAVLLSRLREKLEQAVQKHHPTQAKEYALLEKPSDRLENEIHLVFTSKVTLDDVSLVQSAYDQSVLPYERIRGSSQLSEIPRSDLGKILYAELRKRL